MILKALAVIGIAAAASIVAAIIANLLDRKEPNDV